MSLKVARGFSFFGRGGGDENVDNPTLKYEFSPFLKIQTDKEIYRPGDTITTTIEIVSPEVRNGTSEAERGNSNAFSLMVESLIFEVKGIEKLDTQWFVTQKPSSGSKQRRGEHVFLDCTTPSIASRVFVSSGSTKTYIVRAELPMILPPSYRGTTIRYIYYVRSTLSGRCLVLENGHYNRESKKDLIQLEARAPLQIWVSQKNSNLLADGTQTDGILPPTTVQMDIYWKEKDAESEWARASEISEDEGYDSSRDEISSVSSYNPPKGNIDHSFRNSISMQSLASRASNEKPSYSQDERSFPSYMPLSQLSVAEVVDDSGGGSLSKRLGALTLEVPSPSQHRNYPNSPFANDESGVPSSPWSIEQPGPSEGFVRGRSYNIKIDDQVLLRFSPKNSDSTYYFGDTIGGALTFFHEEGARRCLEVSITLETSETVSQQFVHPSRRSSPTITKIQSDRHEVVADLLQTSFLFLIPMDGPMSFSTPYISVQWVLRFEFFTTPKNVDWSRYEHPLLVGEREKGEWVLPIMVHAPSPRGPPAHPRNDRPI
ncbi:hypothetical protein QJS04_geneDACA014492 [Acorus gramineus]|uniref:Reduced growth phenotype protein 1 n=1 Tax=Acorus gramineus TaxID=55184 RepID=A0AAV9AR70_ACOGR|nr:hypothetical protein QJS04_geneDACA014492 [Acorus gramineus]